MIIKSSFHNSIIHCTNVEIKASRVFLRGNNNKGKTTFIGEKVTMKERLFPFTITHIVFITVCELKPRSEIIIIPIIINEIAVNGINVITKINMSIIFLLRKASTVFLRGNNYKGKNFYR